MKNYIIPLFLLLALTGAQLSGQSHEPFGGTQQNDLGTPQVQKWIKGTLKAGSASASLQRDGSG